MKGWRVAVTSPQQIDDMSKAPDDVMSSMEANADVCITIAYHIPLVANSPLQILQMDYTLGKQVHRDPYQIKVFKGTMTRNIPARFAEVRDEVVTAFSELLPPQDGTCGVLYPSES